MKKLNKEFKSFDEQIDLLKSRGLIISDRKHAKMLLSTVSYYNLVNGYKECFIDPNTGSFISNTSIENLYEFYLLDNGVQNILFKYSVYTETAFKTALAYVIANEISADNEIYLQTNHYRNRNSKSLKKLLDKFIKLCDPLSDSIVDNPTKHYREKHNHIPPWILFKNITFSQSIELFGYLVSYQKNKVIELCLRIDIDKNYENQFFVNCLTTIRKFRNRIAHDLKPITFKLNNAQKLSFDKCFAEYGGTLLLHTDKGTRFNGDMFTMIIALLSITKDIDLLRNFFNDLDSQLKPFQYTEHFSTYSRTTGIPDDIKERGFEYIQSIS